MSDHLTEDDFFNLFDACGKAFGFVLSAALTEATTTGKPFDSRAFARSLMSLSDAERFSPDVNLVVGGIVSGIAAHLVAAKVLQSEDPFFTSELV